MKLYHGTCEDCGYEIYQCGYLEPNPNPSKDNTTYFIDELFRRYTGRNPRENAVYFWDNIESTSGSDCVIKVKLENMDLSKLYVGDYDSVNELYHHRDSNELGGDMSEEEFQSICLDYINKYMDSFMPYEEYLKNKDSYLEKYAPEFLYFDNAKIEIEEDYLEYFDMI